MLLNGTPSWDRAKYYDFGETGLDIRGLCIVIDHLGGVEDTGEQFDSLQLSVSILASHEKTGLENNLVVILYAPGSPYDQYVTAQRADGRPVFANKNGTPLGDPFALNPTVSNQINQGATGASMAGPIGGPQRGSSSTCRPSCATNKQCTSNSRNCQPAPM